MNKNQKQLLLPFAFSLGAIFRRVWGGWMAPGSLFKRVVGYMLPLAVALYSLWDGSWQSYAAAGVIAAVIGTGWWYDLPGVAFLHHAWGMRMGRGGDPRLWKCVMAMGLRYGLVSALAGGVWEAIFPLTGGLFFAAAGWFVPVWYFLAWEAVERLEIPIPTGDNLYYDGATSIGENALGLTMVGGIALAAVIFT